MMKFQFAQMLEWIRAAEAAASAHAVPAVLNAPAGVLELNDVVTDSRAVKPGNVFVALRGERFDAHDFLEAVVAQGAAAVVVERAPPGLAAPAIVVPDARAALGQIAHGWRTLHQVPVIGVTGSNGKTTVKEMIASILAAAFGDEGYLGTRGNFNNEIGVPLTLFRLRAAHRAAVIEMGMNHPGEIAVLSRIAAPTLGLVNNAQREHQEFMATVEAVARENGAVIRHLPAAGVAVFPADDDFTALWREEAGARRVLTFGLNPQADVGATYAAGAFGSTLEVTVKGIAAPPAQFRVELAAVGEHNVRNALAAAACALGAGIAVEAVVRGLENFAPVNGRLQRKVARSGALVIDDTYNANPDSVRAAIDVLAAIDGPRALVLGDMGEVGDQGPQFHREIGAYAKSRGIPRLFGLGELMRHAVQAYGETQDEGGAQARYFDDIAALNAAVEQAAPQGATVLVKGSRFMKMERVVQHLVNVESNTQHQQETH
ncbi:UDP-N-acetylmuramoyl-tripeptide--D-alanyl-D-alanine ligase [Herbaspirillum sp. WKF16]|uniref:UDP-N-acetylmuramoyl-tripeptide--D-alanyl-D- alanine ligase n=1 Tax=Herbaspirillum sp. WKF16 TaxID=3028312 RepID=UPI0023A947BF|nr:UDP-N-acetylmuramoyl-tripeptide--D-alanyl-D-alanine ligase [Herbaspirillum sp. WKF16]WDZ96470.1 UDP-N-acetylmuramoyl-tripeptide--D-alanyl-D-alanine ligase [Herbaspirillum sp. WKF16]